MKKLLFIVLIFSMMFTLIGCDLIDVNDATHDDEYVMVSTYWEIDEVTKELFKVYYVPTINGEIEFIDLLTLGEIELVGQTNILNYELRGNYHLGTQEPLDLYMKTELKWENISEYDYIYSTKKLPNDVLVEYGTIPIISSEYEIGSTIRVIYQDNQAYLHYTLMRVDYNLYIRYGDFRELLN